MSDGYHHGDLRRAILDAAALVIAGRGVAAVSLRDLARKAGVSHAAPAHHFTNKTGLLTALATEGFTMLAGYLATAHHDDTTDLAELGVAYVRFALEHPAHFMVMFDRDALDYADPDLTAARAATGAQLRAGVAELPETVAADSRMAALAAWSLAHGYATLHLDGNIIDPRSDTDPAKVFRAITTMIFTNRGTPSGGTRE